MIALLERVVAPSLLALMLVGTMALVSPWFTDSYREPQELFLVAACWAFIVVVSVARALAGKLPLAGGAGSWFRRALWALGAWVLLRNAFAPDAVGSWAYAQTVVAFLLMAQALLDWLEGDLRRRNFVVGTIAAGLVFQFVVVLLEASHANLSALAGTSTVVGDTLRALTLLGSGEPTVYGTFGNVNYLAEWLVLVGPPIVGFTWGSRYRVAGLVLGALALLCMVQTGCRATVLGLAVGLPVAAFLTFGAAAFQPGRWWADRTMRKYMLGGVGFGLLAVAVVGRRLLIKLADVNTANGLEVGDWGPRVVSYTVARDMWLQNPIVGRGLGYFATFYPNQIFRSFPAHVPTAIVERRFGQVHDEPLQALTELGLVGLLLGLAASALWLRETRANPTLDPSQRLGLMCGVIALAVASLLGFPLHVPLTAATLLALVAVGVAVPAAEPRPAAAWRVPYAVVVALCMAATGVLVVQRVVVPVYAASYAQVLAKGAVAAGDSSNGIDLYVMAYRLQRFKPDALYGWMSALEAAGRYEEAIKLHDAHTNEGMGEASLLLKAIALEHVGRSDEAVAAYKQVQEFYQPENANYKVAQQGLQRLERGN